jgi:hypothetical protein
MPGAGAVHHIKLDRPIRRARPRHVRFAPKPTVADQNVIRRDVPRADIAAQLFNHLVSAPEQRDRENKLPAAC